MSRTGLDWDSITEEDWRTRSVRSIAEQLGCSERTVYNYRSRNSIPSRDSRWDSADWSMTDRELAAKMGVTRQRVNMVRLERDAPKARTSDLTQLIEEWLSENDPRYFLQKEAAELIGVSVSTLSKHPRNMEGIPWGQLRPMQERPGAWQYDWDSITDEDWAARGDTSIAEQLGCTAPAIVTMFRKRHGKPLNPRGWKRVE